MLAAPRGSSRWPILAMALWILALGFYARLLNHLFYQNYGPFYDSLSYCLTLARIYARVRTQGLASAIAYAFTSQSTVVLPWLEASFLALVSELRRDVVVWIQLPWLFVLGLAAYRYFASRVGYPPALAFCLSLPLTAINAVFYFNGGLSDLRMDLLQYTMFGATCLFYLSLRPISHPIRLRSWILWGAMAGLTSLARATTPVYLALVFGPIMLVDAVEQRANLKSILCAYAMAALSFAVLAGWFYVTNWGYLHYYYFVWNSDANAHLPLAESARHIQLAFGQNIGGPLMLFMACALALGAISRARAGRLAWSELNWRALWCGVAPLAFLVLRGAGLNPFVSMVSATGFLVFCEAPWVPVEPARSRWVDGALKVGSLAAVLVTAAAGISYHTRLVSSWIPGSSAVAAVDDQLMADLDRRPPNAYKYALVHMGSMNFEVVLNSLVFDRHLNYREDGSVSNGRWTLEFFGAAQAIATKVQWEAVPGASDADKISGLARALLDESDYLLLPTPSSVLRAQVYINAYAQQLRQLILSSGQLTLLGPAIAVAPGESVEWYRNDRRK